MLAAAFERIGIEEASAIHRHAADEAVVECAFEHVEVFALAVKQEEPVVDIHVADGRTGLGIGTHVGQFVVGPESLTVVGGPDAPRDVEFAAHDVVPDAVDGVYVGRVARERGHIGHAGIHVGRAHGMAHSLRLFEHGQMAL